MIKAIVTMLFAVLAFVATGAHASDATSPGSGSTTVSIYDNPQSGD